jgi:uncharacterized protein
MRLKQKEFQKVIDVLERNLEGCSAQLFLFGSRTDDQMKGGDIDLLLMVETPEQVKMIARKKHVILSELKAEIGDQRIDLKISSPQGAKEDVFLSTILPSAVLLHQWGR